MSAGASVQTQKALGVLTVLPYRPRAGPQVGRFATGWGWKGRPGWISSWGREVGSLGSQEQSPGVHGDEVPRSLLIVFRSIYDFLFSVMREILRVRCILATSVMH